VRSQIARVQNRRAPLGRALRPLRPDELQRYVEDLWTYAETIMRSQIEAMSQGLYAAEGYMDPDLYSDEAVHIVVSVSVGDGRIHADFTGTDAQVRAA